MLGGELCIAIHHLPRLPAAQVLQLVARRSRLPMPGCPGVPQVMEAQIRETRLLDRPPPDLVTDLPPDRLVIEGKAVLLVLSLPRGNHGFDQGLQRFCRLVRANMGQVCAADLHIGRRQLGRAGELNTEGIVFKEEGEAPGGRTLDLEEMVFEGVLRLALFLEISRLRPLL